MAEDLPVAEKFIHPGVTTILFVPTIADVEAPTRTELDAGTNLTEEVTATTGWQQTSTRTTYQPLGSTFTPSIAGRRTVEDSSLTLPQDLAGEDVRTIMPRGTTGFVVIMHGGDVTDSPMDVWPIQVSSLGKAVSNEGSEIANIVVSCAIPSEPAEDIPIPDEAA